MRLSTNAKMAFCFGFGLIGLTGTGAGSIWRADPAGSVSAVFRRRIRSRSERATAPLGFSPEAIKPLS